MYESDESGMGIPHPSGGGQSFGGGGNRFQQSQYKWAASDSNQNRGGTAQMSPSDVM